MAQLINKKFPIDLTARKAVGFGFPLNGGAVFVPTYQTKDQIKANLINYILTNKGERLFYPNFGADLRKYLFEGIVDKTLDNIKSQLQDEISTQFPLVVINDINIDSNPDEHTINFLLSYSIKSFGIEEQINILLQ